MPNLLYPCGTARNYPKYNDRITVDSNEAFIIPLRCRQTSALWLWGSITVHAAMILDNTAGVIHY